MELIETSEYSGYLLEDIKQTLSLEDFHCFQKWFFGQTGVIHKGRLLVYKQDYDNWMNNEKVYD
ncbi:hypothetical protein HYS94_01575 [Candidatus Daviesbacteria bacterium]|nr:hypothetical protein [Candidatus Daviesbacteria bacterium]